MFLASYDYFKNKKTTTEPNGKITILILELFADGGIFQIQQ